MAVSLPTGTEEMEKDSNGQIAGVSEKSEEMLDTLLSHYVAGSLPMPVNTMVEAHLEMRPDSRFIVRGMETVAADQMEEFDPAPLANRDKIFNSIIGSDAPEALQLKPSGDRCPIFPKSLQDFTGFRAGEVPWKTKLPGFKEFSLGEWDGCEAELLWIRAGRAMPAHTHGGSELTLVLNGGFSDVEGHYIRGDIAAADESVDHRPIADPDETCICLAITTAPLKLTGSMTQLFSDIFGR
ncbi:MAG: ChrR family anti-sigma-E factor [Rhizobiaceae bacterium]